MSGQISKSFIDMLLCPILISMMGLPGRLPPMKELISISIVYLRKQTNKQSNKHIDLTRSVTNIAKLVSFWNIHVCVIIGPPLQPKVPPID